MNTHLLISDGCFYGEGKFKVAPKFHLKKLEALFQHKVLKMLLKKGKINKDLISMLLSWRHSGFNVFCGKRIYPADEIATEHLARYIIRASFSQERMSYLRDESKVIYQSKDGKQIETFDALEWLATMRIIAFIEREDLIKRILKHVGLWEVKSRPPPRTHSPPGDFHTDYSDSQIPPWDDNYSDPDYPFEAYI